MQCDPELHIIFVAAGDAVLTGVIAVSASVRTSDAAV
jgi:hypothetical protein